MADGRRFLVTGALGAIGVWTMRSLLERGHEVVAFDLGGDTRRMRLALSESQRAAVTMLKGDITDLAAVERGLDEHEITGVIHLAALQVPFVRADPVHGARVNVVGTVNVLEAARRRADRLGPVVYASSIAVYAGGRASLAADDQPGTLYGVFKRANEGTAQRYFEDYGLSSIGLRPHTVYGPARDQGLTSAPTLAMVAAAAGRSYHIPFGGSAQFQYTADVGEAVAQTALLEYEGASVHDLDGHVAAIADVTALIERAAPGASITADEAPLPFPAEVGGASFVELLGGSVMRPLDEGIADAVDRFRRLLADGLVQPPE